MQHNHDAIIHAKNRKSAIFEVNSAHFVHKNGFTVEPV